MTQLSYDLSYLSDPGVFAVNRLPAHSDHDCYQTAAEAEAEASSLRYNLNGQWKFSYAETVSSRPVGFQAPDFDDSRWAEITVPGHLQLQGYGEPQYVNIQYPWDGHEALRPPEIPKERNPVGSYIRWFELPPSFASKRVTVTFHGVETAFFCWLNGVLLGYGEDSFTPSGFDLTPALRPGRNKLAVEVFRYSSASWLEDQDFWRFSGIFRDVELTAQPAAHVRDLFCHTDLDDDFRQGTLKVEATLALPQAPVALRYALLDKKNKAVLTGEAPATAQCAFSHPVERPLLWSAEEPSLYTLRLTLLDESGRELEVAQTKVGFRRVEIKNGLLLLNGKRLLFRGADRHEFCPESGRALSAEIMLRDVLILKRNNLNAVRTSHYPNNSLWYRLCDQYGVYLIDEANLETHGTWNRQGEFNLEYAIPYDNPAWLPAILDRAASMQERDKNHPSVLLWSCGNESYGGKDFWEMANALRKRDPSRPVHYEGVFYDRRFNDTSDVESRMYPPAAEVAAFIEAHPEKPFLLCEYTHAMGNSCGGMAKYIALEDRYPQYQGGFIWDFVDQALWVTAPNGRKRLAYGGDFGDRPTDREFCGNGVVLADRSPTPKLQEIKYLYQDVRLKPDADGVTVENRALFTNTNQYDLRWTFLRDGAPVQAGRLNAPDVPPGETRRFPLPVSAPALPGEYVLHCGLYHRAPVSYADTEYEQMHGEAIIAFLAAPKPAAALPIYHTIYGDNNVGAHGDSFRVLFSRIEGGPCSFRLSNGRELLETAPSLSLFRAPTSNDIGNGDWRREAPWQTASLFAVPRPPVFTQKDGLLSATYQYELPIAAGAELSVCYTVQPDGRLLVEMTYGGMPNLPDMAAFGLSFRLPADVNDVRYYGLGPDECYADRKEGAVLALHRYNAQSNLTPYLWPGECGNREGVRTLSVTDRLGHGLIVEHVDAPLSISVLPHSAMELFLARHPDELPAPSYTYLDVALKRKGVGGDDSWGAPVLPAYHIPSDQPMTLRFYLGVR